MYPDDLVPGAFLWHHQEVDVPHSDELSERYDAPINLMWLNLDGAT